LAQFQTNPTKLALKGVRNILRYLKGTLNYSIFISYPKAGSSPTFVLIPFSDASFSIPILDLRSASGILFLLNRVPVHWISRKQRLISLSSTETEIVAGSLCSQELLWILQILNPLVKLEKPISLCIDNLSMKYIAESILMSHRTKHLEIRHLFIKQLLLEHPVILKWVPSDANLADIFTKYISVVGNFKTLASSILRECAH
jgi:hypothetical protein